MSAARTPFSIRSRDPHERARFWFWDPSHFPGPVTPAAETFDLPAMAAGFAAAAADLERPLAGQYVRVERGFVYFGIDVPSSSEALQARERAFRVRVEPLLDVALEQWTEIQAPAVERLNLALADLARASCDDADFAEALGEAIRLRSEQWRIHDVALVPAMEAAARFTAAYADRLGGAIALQAMLQGFPNRQTEAAEALDRFAEAVRERGPLVSWLTAASRVRPISAAPSTERAWFRGALAGFLETYGRRAEGWDAGTPTWTENPSPVLALLRERLRRPAAEPGWQRRRAAERRDAAVTAAMAGLADAERPQFLRLLRAAQAYPVVSEDHNALIDQGGMAALRDVILAAGERLARSGSLRRPASVVWLRRDEIVETLRSPRDLTSLVASRRRQRRLRSRMTPPATIGGPLPDWAAHNATLTEFFGLGAEPSPSGEELVGSGVSAGVAEGRAFVARQLDDLEGIEEGDILVCPTTSPAWTPWLGLIAGAVVETGGMLSHTAVLAREYGIPCVANVRGATERIEAGTRIRVDGTNGSVTLLR